MGFGSADADGLALTVLAEDAGVRPLLERALAAHDGGLDGRRVA